MGDGGLLETTARRVAGQRIPPAARAAVLGRPRDGLGGVASAAVGAASIEGPQARGMALRM